MVAFDDAFAYLTGAFEVARLDVCVFYQPALNQCFAYKERAAEHRVSFEAATQLMERFVRANPPKPSPVTAGGNGTPPNAEL